MSSLVFPRILSLIKNASWDLTHERWQFISDQRPPWLPWFFDPRWPWRSVFMGNALFCWPFFSMKDFPACHVWRVKHVIVVKLISWRTPHWTIGWSRILGCSGGEEAAINHLFSGTDFRVTGFLVPYVSIQNKLRAHYKSGCWFGTFFIFPYIGFLIIPTDELIFFRGVAQPPLSTVNSGVLEDRYPAGF